MATTSNPGGPRGDKDDQAPLSPRPSDFPASASSSSSSLSTSTSDSLQASTDDLQFDYDELECVAVDGTFSVCPMKTVSVSSVLKPSPCFVVLLLVCPLVLGFVVFLFVQHFVPVLVDILINM